MSSLARTERAALCDLLDELGPHAPTLCEGWHTRDLAAHLVLRESRPDAAAGIVFPPLHPWTRRLQSQLGSGDFAELVQRLRTGPPRFSFFRPVDELANGIEFFVHHEDVRRARTDWRPRQLDDETANYLWRRSCRMARLALRHEKHGVEFVRADTGERRLVRRPPAGHPTTALHGNPAEFLMYVFGRRDHALVD